ncbi:MAG: hypothetical protein U9N14_06210, partial [Pseudomonadota bacterium]|nr:hypothetical protein [Pseudomonadota bacterium]
MGALKYPILEQSCLMVAASNAPDDKKHAAHYVCDGVDDQVQIQQAIDMIETLGNGGVVLLTEGVFEIDPSVGIRGVDGLVLQGSGASLGTNGTVLYVSAGTGTLFSLKQADANAGVRVHLKDLAFKGYAVDETIDLCGLDCAGMKVAKIENVFFTLFPKAIYAHGGQFYSGTPVTHVCNEIFFDVWMISVGRGFYALGKNGC